MAIRRTRGLVPFAQKWWVHHARSRWNGWMSGLQDPIRDMIALSWCYLSLRISHILDGRILYPNSDMFWRTASPN